MNSARYSISTRADFQSATQQVSNLRYKAAAEMKPLEGLLVLDFSQFLAGPAAALRLGDLGARVIKIERPGTGDLCRQLYISNLGIEGDSTLFHSINRNKQSFAADLKNRADLAAVKNLLKRTDVVLQNFRPGVMARIGLEYDDVRAINPRVVYGRVTGYGTEGPWADLPGQDLLAQSVSGLTWLSGDASHGPVPMGLAVADLAASAHLVQGVLACLVRRGVTGQGGLVEVSLLESILDLQFEVFSTHLNDGGQEPQRSEIRNGHAYLGAPYGIYRTADSWIALSMGSVTRLGEILECAALQKFTDPKTWFTQRDEIKAVLRNHLATKSIAWCLEHLRAADYWCAEVLNWSRLREEEAYKALGWEQTITLAGGSKVKTSRCPIRIDGERFYSDAGSPRVGQHNTEVQTEFGL